MGTTGTRNGRGFPSALIVCTALVLMAGCASTSSTDATGRPDSSSPTTTVAPAVTGALRTGAPGARRLTVEAALHLHQITNVVPTPTTLWVLGGASRHISVVDPRTNRVVQAFTLPHPAGFGTYLHGSMWISSFADSVVMQVDPATGHIVRTVSGSRTRPLDHPVGLVSAGNTVWVVQHRKAILTRIDARTGAITGNTALPGTIAGDPALSAGRIWVPLGTGGQPQTLAVRVNPATARVEGPPINLGGVACGTSSMVNAQFWFTSPGEAPCTNTVRFLDTRTATLSPTQFGPGTDLFAVAVAGGSMWAGDTRSTIYRVDTSTGHVIPALPLEGAPDFNRLLSAFGSLWVIRGDTGRLLRLRAT